MKKSVFLIFAIIALTFVEVQAQYKNSAGIRFGYTSAVTYKRFIKDEQALELMGSSRNNGFQLTMLFNNHKPMEVSFNDNFYFNYGIGGHVGFEKRNVYRVKNPYTTPFPDEFSVHDKTTFVMGVDAIFGVEYRWLSVPMTFGLDFKPYFDYVGWRETNFRFWDMAITFKYIF